MNDLKPIIIDNGVLELHPFRNSDAAFIDKLEQDLFEILSDDENTEFIPEKRIKKKDDASNFLTKTVFGYQQKTNYTHFLSIKEPRKTIGVIDLISPTRVEMEYGMKDTWFIEYFLNKRFWQHSLMGDAVASVMQNMELQGVERMGALCFIENLASITLLKNMGFEEIDLSRRGLASKPSPKYTQKYFEIILG